MEKKNYGSCKYNIPIHSGIIDKTDIGNSISILVNELNIKEYQNHFVKPLSQEELAEGWIQNVRNPDSKIINEKKIRLYNTFNINLAQLPKNLWHKIKPIYKENALEYYVVKYKRFKYIIELTQFDNEIKTLYNLITNYNYNKKDQLQDLVDNLESNDIYGWIIIQGKKLLTS